VPHNRERRSDRIYLTLAIKVAGTDALGVSFVDDAQTVIVNRDGAKILASRKLAPEQEVSIHCLETGGDAVGRVVGQMGEELDGYYYGIKFIDSTSNPWGIDFPAIERGNRSVGRAVLECVGCHAREIVYLDEFEIEVLEANASIARECTRCTQSTLWKKSLAEAPPAPKPETALEKRREPRRELRVRASIRSLEFGEEIVWTRNVSRGGLCFESRRHYDPDSRVEVAIPYSSGGGNIFLPARIARVQALTSSDVVLCGVSYIRDPRSLGRHTR
jgi:PilZ domain